MFSGGNDRGRGNGQGGKRGWSWRGRGRYNWRGRGAQNFSQSSQSSTHRPDAPHPLTQTRLEVISPYNGWKLYFPDEGFSDNSPTVKKIKIFQKYIVDHPGKFSLDVVELNGFFTIDFKDLLVDRVVTEEIPGLSMEMKESPQSILSSLGLAMHQLIYMKKKREDEAVGDCNSIVNMSLIYARVLNFSSSIALKNVKANCYGKFVCVKGTVVRVSTIKPLCICMAFECGSCANVQSILLPGGKYILPTKCPADQCRGRAFTPVRSSALTQTIDWQTIRVQEIMGDGQKESGRIPRTIDCELTRDLVDSCVPGDVVTVSGIVKVNNLEEGKNKNKDKCMFLLYLEVNSVNNLKGKQTGGAGSLAVEYSIKELYAIEEIHSQDNLFTLLVGSLCPTIYGHELVKAGLILGLFGGSQKFTNDKNRIPVRGDPHILVVGDPGLGKSQMLQAVASVAPRSVYVCGNTTTTSGLTVTMSKDGGSGDYGLEAGALVLADQGCCCIDEFDKMTNQHQALLEAMEQQSISIAKAGIVCSLPARTSIIAAANPVGGHYNQSKTVSENLKLGSALLSRFDLVFILLDKPDEVMDNMLSEHVMALHAGKQLHMHSVTASRSQVFMDQTCLQWERDKPLSEKLKIPRKTPFDPIPYNLLRKYIGYARKYVHTKIGPQAAKVLQDFYLDLRKRQRSQDSTPITTRQLESLVRLTEARARMELRELATAQDAEDVVEIMKYSMFDVYSNQCGGLDISRSQLSSANGKRSQPKRFISALQRVSEQTANNIFTMQQMKQIASDIGMSVLDFEGFVSSINNQGFLLKKGPKVYQLQTSGF